MSTDDIVTIFAAASEGPMIRDGYKTVRVWDVPEDRRAEAEQWVETHGAIHKTSPVVLAETGTADTSRDPHKVQQGDTLWLVPRAQLPNG